MRALQLTLGFPPLALTAVLAGLLSGCSLLSGCGARQQPAVEERSLAELGSSVELDLGDGWLALAPADGEEPDVCYAISPSSSATFDGHPMLLRERGRSRGMLNGESYCEYPVFFTLDGTELTPELSTNTLVVSDGTATWTMVVENYTTEHEVTLAVPEGTAVPSGAGVPFELLPAAQINSVTMYVFEGDGLIDPETSSESDAVYSDMNCTPGNGCDIEGNLFTYDNGGWDPGLWHVNGRFDIGLTVTQCAGPAHCEAVIRHYMPDTNVLIGPES